MDLVASYSSDESESETRKQVYEFKKINVVNRESSNLVDTEAVALQPINLSEYNDKKDRDHKTSNDKNTEFISFSDSDSENGRESFVNIRSNRLAQRSPNTKMTSEKIDFLNLESSDTDEEQQSFQNSVDNLLCSAAILNDIEYGPMKPNPGAGYFDATTSKIAAATPLISDSNFVYTGKRNITPQSTSSVSEDDSSKKFKPNTETDDHIELESCGSAVVCVPKDLIYRNDERVLSTCHKNICHIPNYVTRTYIAHTSVITALSWCISQYSHLLLSASADCTLKIWDMFSKNPVQCFKDSSGLKAAKWSLNGKQLVTGGYGKKAHVYDVPSGSEIVAYDINNFLTSLQIHPNIGDVFLCGTRDDILAFDVRVNSALPIRTFTSKCEEVLDIAFLDDNQFACSTNVVSHDSADRTIMVWDFSSGAVLSNQIFLERYTCPSLKVNHHDSSFVAQTNGDYIALFSTCRPYKIKHKRYMGGHKVSGYGIECDISPDGKYLASGDANGEVYFYNYCTTDLIQKLTAKSGVATNRLRWHPSLSSTLATSTWDGHLQIWK